MTLPVEARGTQSVLAAGAASLHLDPLVLGGLTAATWSNRGIEVGLHLRD